MTTASDLDILLIRPQDVAEESWDVQVRDLSVQITRWIGNDTRLLQFTVAELAERASNEPVLRDVLREGLTVAGTRTWLADQLPTPKD